MDEKVKEIRNGIEVLRASKYIDNHQWLVDWIEYLLSLLSEKEKHEENYQLIMKEILLCNPIPARERQDDTLEPPWEVVARIRERLVEKERKIAQLLHDKELIAYGVGSDLIEKEKLKDCIQALQQGIGEVLDETLPFPAEQRLKKLIGKN